MMVEKPDTFKHALVLGEPAAKQRVVESADIFRGTNDHQ
ncbi:hypothetical protein ABID08_004724 [Rhizobium binae]|uniref:Uncharacterized protein n=1 Tax=Rhizobium binae TaxID=1138190 RepID=A0ABV2MLK8_9HYPH